MTTAATFASRSGSIEAPAPGKYWANMPPSEVPLEQWMKQFERDGFLFVKSVLPPETTAVLREQLDRAYIEQMGNGGTAPDRVIRRMFEFSPANLALFDLEPIVTFAEQLVDANCHVIHNNSFCTPKGKGLSYWHTDDPAHYLVTEGEPPTNVRLPVLWFTANYYLTNVESVEQGATQLIKRSHLLGKPCPQDPTVEHRSALFDCIGPAGSVIMFNNQVWHRGAINQTDHVRKITQVTYARRLIGHMFFPFMNYVMPEHVYRDANPRLKRLLGFLPSGAYG